MTSHATTSSTATPSSFADERRRTRRRRLRRAPTSARRAAGGRARRRARSRHGRGGSRAAGDAARGRSTSTRRTSPTAQRDASRETEVAVEPRVDERAAVHVDADLAVPGAARVGTGLHAQVRAVGVGADHDEARSRVVGDVPRDDRAAPHRVRAARRCRRAARRCSRGGSPPRRAGPRPTRPRGTATASERGSRAGRSSVQPCDQSRAPEVGASR